MYTISPVSLRIKHLSERNSQTAVNYTKRSKATVEESKGVG